MIVEGDKAVVIAFERYGSHVTGRTGVQTYAWLFIRRGDQFSHWRLFEDTEAISRCFG
jgi:ketosteroid isomerase-like protein